ncbi:uncharacterized protein METZ01_LOCUS144442 [marine metagenome]|uniref:Uncharacterized protein n=1 Tax=marine metagenome TaxID=408172 RepID=A0A381ZQL5_9ZZZZ
MSALSPTRSIVRCSTNRPISAKPDKPPLAKAPKATDPIIRDLLR